MKKKIFFCTNQVITSAKIFLPSHVCLSVCLQNNFVLGSGQILMQFSRKVRNGRRNR